MRVGEYHTTSSKLVDYLTNPELTLFATGKLAVETSFKRGLAVRIRVRNSKDTPTVDEDLNQMFLEATHKLDSSSSASTKPGDAQVLKIPGEGHLSEAKATKKPAASGSDLQMKQDKHKRPAVGKTAEQLTPAFFNNQGRDYACYLRLANASFILCPTDTDESFSGT